MVKLEDFVTHEDPKKKELNPITNEYLVQGKVKVLKKVMEIKNN